jgi:hypothetical protein
MGWKGQPQSNHLSLNRDLLSTRTVALKYKLLGWPLPLPCIYKHDTACCDSNSGGRTRIHSIR